MKILGKVEEILVVACLGIMTLLTFANVIARYVFSASFSFSEEITTYLFVLLSLLGAAIAAKRKAHLGLTILTDLANKRVYKWMAIVGYGVAVLFSGAIFYYGILMVKSQIELKQVTAAMQWPEWIFGSFVPIGSAFVVIRFAQNLIEAVRIKTKEVSQ